MAIKTIIGKENKRIMMDIVISRNFLIIRLSSQSNKNQQQKFLQMAILAKLFHTHGIVSSKVSPRHFDLFDQVFVNIGTLSNEYGIIYFSI
jgi:hypothetical protein